MATGDNGPIAFTVNAQRHPLFLVMLLLVCVVLFVSCGGGNATAPAPSTATAPPTPMASPTPTPVVGVTNVTITITAKFQPANFQVPVGTTVTWTNNDNVPHTVTFRNGMKDSGISLFLAGGAGTFSYTFASKGIFPYYCRIHPSMVGVVTVT
jgi:plastocyanin